MFWSTGFDSAIAESQVTPKRVSGPSPHPFGYDNQTKFNAQQNIFNQL